MGPLEDVLRKVEDLRRDLSAEIVVKEEEGHFEDREDRGGPGDEGRNLYSSDLIPVWIVDHPKIAHPDIKKREAAKLQLQQIYDSSEWYSVKYIISHSVGNYRHGMFVTELPFPTNLDIWTQDMRQRMNEPQKHQAYKLDILKDAGVLLIELRKLTWLSRCDDEQKLMKFIKDCYASDPDKEIRTQAARYLNYPTIRIWAHEHPVSATMAGVAAAGAASGLGYILYQYFSK